LLGNPALILVPVRILFQNHSHDNHNSLYIYHAEIIDVEKHNISKTSYHRFSYLESELTKPVVLPKQVLFQFQTGSPSSSKSAHWKNEHDTCPGA
jgi:hypothetical protein